ncbi:MAG TPA: metal-dependent transcriptional regulator [Gemmatimonadaceae bacterium]|jgi:DtxR family Mn-dependent transcriptional regulator|nr:metal-dependent transcriptional regulator [Gemmatimonadaceae bacterium]
MTYTASVEDYLKTIYDLERNTGTATTTDIAHRLAIAPASVTGMVRRLAGQGLLTHEPYHGVRLSDEGQRVALLTLRRHRVIETYLARVLNYPWDEVHAEADRLEHAASDALIDRMAQAMGEPRVDPHGAPIPTREGHVDERHYAALSELPLGARARIVRVSDEDPARLRYLAELGLVPGACVTVVSRAPYEGPIELRVDDADGGATRRAIGPALAAGIHVES